MVSTIFGILIPIWGRLSLTIIFAKEPKPPTSSMLRGQNGSKTFFFLSKKSRVSFEKSTEEQIGVSDTDDSVSEASMATDETGGIPDYRKRRASDGFHRKNYFVSLPKQSNGLEVFFFIRGFDRSSF